jgi:cytochrome c-type biogenesis protein CcmE
VPDIFKDNVEVVVEGVYDRDGVFAADTLLAKCPSKFESKPGAVGAAAP